MKMTPAIVIAGGIMVFLAVVMAVVFIPGFVWDPPQTWIAHPYTSEQEQGREVFYSNGCNYCHTQYSRYFDTAGGPVSMGGNYVFDSPMILGSERTGPDLSYIGRKRSEAWEIRHWKDPREMSPLSIMPSFEFLSDEDLNAMATYLFNMGDRTSSQTMIRPPFPYALQSDPVEYPMVQPASGDQGWDYWIEAKLQEGKELYITHCLTCHGCAGNGLGHYAGTMVATPADYKQEPFRSMPDDEWFWHVSEGVQGTLMPTWKASLSEEQRWLVIRYIQQIFANPVERDPAEGDPPGEYANATNPLPLTVDVLEEGKHIFIRECWVCHGDAAKGEGVYRHGLLPVPPDFSDQQSYVDFTDADYYWRISEGVPWTAMPTWKLEYSEEDRWKLVHYIRVNFTQTEQRPVSNAEMVYPGIYLAQEMPQSIGTTELLQQDLDQPQPVTPSFAAGKAMYLQMCAHCHGLTGVGDGWDGEYLDVKPANFTGEMVRGLSDGDWFARVSFGIQNSAMPTWGEWMPFENRWNVIKFLEDGIVQNQPAQVSGSQGPTIVPSVYADGAVAANFIQTSSALWQEEGHTISADHGAELYDQFCAECHAADGGGKGPGTVDHGIPSPAPFASNMSESYTYWRIWEGVPETLMPPYKAIFASGDVWDLTAYLESLGFTTSGG